MGARITWMSPRNKRPELLAPMVATAAVVVMAGAAGTVVGENRLRTRREMQGPGGPIPMKHVCAWCDAKPEPNPLDQSDNDVSHGLCPQCAALIETSGSKSLMIKIETRATGPSLALEGEVDHENVGQLIGALRTTIDTQSPRIVLNLSKLNYIDSAGIAAVYQLIERVDGGKEIEMTGVSPNLWRILQVSGLTAHGGVRIAPQEKSSSQSSAPISPRAPGRGKVLPRSIVFAGRLDQLARIREFAGKAATDAHLDEARTYNLQVAVSEASANAIEHGLPAGNLSLSSLCEGGRLTIIVSHPGCFLPRSGEDPARSHRGMGVPLMLALTDEVTVSHPPGAGTRVSLSLFLD